MARCWWNNDLYEESSMNSRSCSATIAALLLALSHAPAHSQELNLQLVPKLGVYTPLNSLTDGAEAEVGVAFGLAGEFVLPRLPFNIRVNLDHANATNIVTRDAAESALGTVSITNVTGDIVLRPLAATALFRPYFLGGAGVKLYSFDVPAPGRADLAGVVGTTRRTTLHVGGGVDVRFGPAALLLEVSDYLSTLPDAEGGTRLQNDLFGMIGFRVTMF
jgi:hypothetical protein